MLFHRLDCQPFTVTINLVTLAFEIKLIVSKVKIFSREKKILFRRILVLNASPFRLDTLSFNPRK